MYIYLLTIAFVDGIHCMYVYIELKSIDFILI